MSEFEEFFKTPELSTLLYHFIPFHKQFKDQKIPLPKLVKLECKIEENRVINNSTINKITTKNLEEIEIFNCQFNNIEIIEEIDLINVKELNLSNNNICSMPNISHLKKLEKLDVSQNQLTNLPDLKELKDLLTLNIQNNKLKLKVFDNLYQLKQLKYLKIFANPCIETINEYLLFLFSIFPKMVAIDGISKDSVNINLNSHFTLTESLIKKYTNEKKGKRCLDLQGLDLFYVDPNCKLDRVEKLNLSYNYIFNYKILSSCINLISLEFEGLSIDCISWISGLKHLKYINFNYNNIKSLKDFPLLKNAEYLSICKNQIDSFSGIENFPKLRELDISENLIDNLETEILGLRRAEELEKLYLHGNPLSMNKDYRLFVIHKIPYLLVKA